MSKQMLIVTGLVLMLLVAFAAPAVAAPPNNGSTAPSRVMDWAAPEGSLFSPPQGMQPNGDCETIGSGGSC